MLCKPGEIERRESGYTNMIGQKKTRKIWFIRVLKAEKGSVLKKAYECGKKRQGQ